MRRFAIFLAASSLPQDISRQQLRIQSKMYFASISFGQCCEASSQNLQMLIERHNWDISNAISTCQLNGTPNSWWNCAQNWKFCNRCPKYEFPVNFVTFRWFNKSKQFRSLDMVQIHVKYSMHYLPKRARVSVNKLKLVFSLKFHENIGGKRIGEWRHEQNINKDGKKCVNWMNRREEKEALKTAGMSIYRINLMMVYREWKWWAVAILVEPVWVSGCARPRLFFEKTWYFFNS